MSVDLPTALAAAGKAVEIAGRARAGMRSFAIANLGLALHVAGDWAKLRELLDDAGRQDIPDAPNMISTTTIWLREADGSERVAADPEAHNTGSLIARQWGWQQRLAEARRSGDPELLARTSEQSLAASREACGFGDDFPVLWPICVLASIAAGDLDQAARQIALMEDAPRGHVLPLARAQLPRLQGMLAISRGEDPQALLTAAIDALDRFGAVPDAARTRHALGAWLADQGRADEAAELLDAARQTYTDLGATVWLAELDAHDARAQQAPGPAGRV